MRNELLDVARKETNSILRQKGYNALSSPSFHGILDEMTNRCPTVFQILSNMLQYDVKERKILPPWCLCMQYLCFVDVTS